MIVKEVGLMDLHIFAFQVKMLWTLFKSMFALHKKSEVTDNVTVGQVWPRK